MAYLISVIQIHDPTPLCAHVLVALLLPAHTQGRVHVHVMAREVERYQALEDHAVGRLCGCKEDQQARSGAAISDHIEDSAKAGGLVEAARGPAVKRVEKAGDGVEKAAAAWV
jgi:hypothetical protein